MNKPHHHITEDLTISEFCVLEGISVPTFHILRKLDLMPEESFIPGTPFTRISAAARRKWREKMEQANHLINVKHCSIAGLRKLGQKPKRGRPQKPLQAAKQSPKQPLEAAE